MKATGQTADGRTHYHCEACGATLTTRDPLERVHCLCGSKAWPKSPATQLTLISRWLDAFYRGHPVDLAGAKARLAKCLGECSHFQPPRCSLAGDTCESRRRWFGWILAGECKRFEPRLPLN